MWRSLPTRRLAQAAVAMLQSGQLALPATQALLLPPAAAGVAATAVGHCVGLRGFAALPLAAAATAAPPLCRSYAKAAKNKKDKKGGGSSSGGNATAAPQQGGSSGGDQEGPWDPAATKALMERALEHLHNEFANLRSGRATPGMFDHLKAEAYGERQPLKALCTSSVRDSHLLTLSVFDPETVPAIERALRDGPLKLNPRTEGQEVLVPIPKPTPDSVAGMTKLARAEAEDAKVVVRQQRKRAMDALKAGAASEDERKRAEKEVQAMTDAYVAEVDRVLGIKEKELGTVL